MKKVLIVALSLAMSCTACSTAWVSTLDSIVAGGGPALVKIFQIVALGNRQTAGARRRLISCCAVPGENRDNREGSLGEKKKPAPARLKGRRAAAARGAGGE